MRPYYESPDVVLYHGDCRKVLPALGRRFDAALADPPYGETSLTWDRWPTGWLAAVARVTDSLWCFGSLRLFMARAPEFAAQWKLSQENVATFEIDTMIWEKRNGTGFACDRFRRVHEPIGHFYRGAWRDLYHDVPRVPAVYDAKGRAKSVSSPQAITPHTGAIGAHRYEDDGLRLTRSVIHAPSVRGRAALHRTQKPVEVLTPLIEYVVPPGGTVLDPMAGSGSTAVAARQLGRRCVLIEADERYCETTAHRLDQGVLAAAGETG